MTDKTPLSKSEFFEIIPEPELVVGKSELLEVITEREALERTQAHDKNMNEMKGKTASKALEKLKASMPKLEARKEELSPKEKIELEKLKRIIAKAEQGND